MLIFERSEKRSICRKNQYSRKGLKIKIKNGKIIKEKGSRSHINGAYSSAQWRHSGAF